MRWKGLLAALIGLLMIGITAGSASAAQLTIHNNDQIKVLEANLEFREALLNAEFIEWCHIHHNNLPQSKAQAKRYFAEFLRENPNAIKELREINTVQRTVLTWYPDTNNAIFNIKTVHHAYRIYNPTTKGEEEIKVTIHYLRVHLLRWDITYGEIDKFNWLYTGSKAKKFFDEWESKTTNAGYATTLLGFGTTLIKFPNAVSIAIGAALTAIGLTITYEGSEMLSYYESTNWQYIWMVLENDYYYPWVPVMNMACVFSIYGYNIETGKKYTFLPPSQIPTVGILTNAAISGMISAKAHEWINSHGSNWVVVG
ncbi:hypothetical protein [Thermococcus sp.]|uniref:hypothetical protein n=1 Tax=Thermococcus sp. TaxID=35749 RepID=UPI00261C6A27|nr:hypothetical protein [Thermococcus sp.]